MRDWREGMPSDDRVGAGSEVDAVRGRRTEGEDGLGVGFLHVDVLPCG